MAVSSRKWCLLSTFVGLASTGCVGEGEIEDAAFEQAALEADDDEPPFQQLADEGSEFAPVELESETTTAGGDGFAGDGEEADALTEGWVSTEDDAVLLATLTLAGDVEVDFLATGPDSIGIGVGGPIGSPVVEAVASKIACSSTPSDLYAGLAPTESVPVEIQEHSTNVVNAGNWVAAGSDGCSDAAPVEGAGDLQDVTSNASDAPSGTEAFASEGDPAFGVCGSASAYSYSSSSHPLHASHGNCNSYTRPLYGTTQWNYVDILAFVGHVIVIDGVVLWEVRKKNCKNCNWYSAYDRVIAAGYNYYYYNNTPTNDAYSSSVVTCLHEGGCTHLHDVARCHDWNNRAVWTSGLAGGCMTQFGSNTLFCSDTGYIGADPSIIHTSIDWNGNGTSWPHC